MLDIQNQEHFDSVKVFDKLQKPERFWDWLEGIAFNKVRNHYGKRWRRKTSAALGIPAYRVLTNATIDRIAEMVWAIGQKESFDGLALHVL